MKTNHTYAGAARAVARLRKLPGVSLEVERVTSSGSLIFVSLKWHRPDGAIYGSDSAYLLVSFRKPSAGSLRLRRSASVSCTIMDGRFAVRAAGLDATRLFFSTVKGATDRNGAAAANA